MRAQFCESERSRALPVWLLISLVILALLRAPFSAADPGSSAEQETRDALSQSALLRHIPLETPYLFGHFGPWSPADAQALGRMWLESASERGALLKRLSAELEAGRGATLNDLARRLALPSSAEAWAELGFKGLPEFAVYGVGLIPSLALAVDDRARFEAWLTRLGAGLEHGFSARSHPKGEYWRRPFKRWTLIAKLIPAPQAAAGGVLRLSLIPKSAEATLLTSLITTPEEAMSSQRLTERLLVFSDQVEPSGWIELEAIISSLFIKPPAALAPSARALGFPLPQELAGTCGAELVAISAAAPRLSIGSSPSRERLESLLHLSPETLGLLRGLSLPLDPLPAPSPTSSAPAFKVALALNPLGLAPLMRRLARWAEQPWRCPIIKSLNRLSPSPEQLSQLPYLSPLIAPLRGVELQINELTSGSDGELRGWLALRDMNPARLLMMVQAMGAQAPRWLQALSLTQDGAPTRLLNAPQPWRAPQLSSSPGGVVLSFDQASADAGLHARYHAHYRSQGDPLTASVAPSSPLRAPLLSLSYRADTVMRLQELMSAFKSRAKALSTNKNQGGEPKLNKESQTESTIESTALSYTHRVITLTQHEQGLMIQTTESPRKP